MLSLAVRSAHPLASPAFDLFMKFSREGDREVFAVPGMKHMFLDDMLRASRSGIRSMVFDYLLFSRDWGFSLADIDRPEPGLEFRWCIADDWKLIESVDGQTKELYRVSTDPREEKDLAAANPGQAKALSDRIKAAW